MNSKILKNSSIYFLGSLANSALGIVLLPLYTKNMSVEDYGVVSSIKVFIAVISIIYTFAIEKSVYRLYFEYKTEEEKKRFFGTVYISIFIFSMGFSAIMFLFDNYVSKIYSDINFYPYFALAIAYTFFNGFSLVPIIYYQIVQKPVTYISITISKLVINNLCLIYFVILNDGGAEGYLTGNVAGILIMMPVFLTVMFRTSIMSFSKKIFKTIMQYSLPLVPSQAASWIIGMSDRVFLEQYHNLNDVGVYSLAYRIGTLTIFFSGSFFKAYNPYFYSIANSEKVQNAKEKLKAANHSFIYISLLFGFFLAFFSKEVIQIFFDERYMAAKSMIPIIALGYVFSQTFGGLFNLSIYQNKKTNYILYTTFIGALVNIGLNFLLIPKFGGMGAAYATVLTFLTTFNIRYYFVKKSYLIPFEWGKIGGFVAILFSVYFLFELIDFGYVLSIIIKLVVCIIIFIILYKNMNYSWIKLKNFGPKKK